MKIKNILIAAFVGISLVTNTGYAGFSSRSSGFSGGSRSSSFSSSSRSSGFSGSSSRSSGFSTPSSSYSSKSTIASPSSSSGKSTGWANTSSSSSSGWGNSSKIATPSGATSYRTPSSADTTLRNKSIQSGTSYQSRDHAMNDFKTKYADRYPTKFTSEPRIRPSYIPSYYTYSGVRYNVIYNSMYGGYGYWGPGHVWMAYDIMMDTMMLNSLMYNHGYNYPGAVGYVNNGGYVDSPVVYSSGMIGFSTFILIFLATLFIVLLVLTILANV
jgi:hypothetical protein